ASLEAAPSVAAIAVPGGVVTSSPAAAEVTSPMDLVEAVAAAAPGAVVVPPRLAGGEAALTQWSNAPVLFKADGATGAGAEHQPHSAGGPLAGLMMPLS